jgi:hypothetical protein
MAHEPKGRLVEECFRGLYLVFRQETHETTLGKLFARLTRNHIRCRLRSQLGLPPINGRFPC